jgi:hypothetical protein
VLLRDVHGRLLLSESQGSQGQNVEFDLHAFPPGLYILEYRNSNNPAAYYSFLKP